MGKTDKDEDKKEDDKEETKKDDDKTDEKDKDALIELSKASVEALEDEVRGELTKRDTISSEEDSEDDAGDDDDEDKEDADDEDGDDDAEKKSKVPAPRAANTKEKSASAKNAAQKAPNGTA